MTIDLTHGIHGIKEWDTLKATQSFEVWKKEIQEWIFLKVLKILWDILKAIQSFEVWKKEIQEWTFLKVWKILWDDVTIFEGSGNCWYDDNSPINISLKELAQHVERIGNTNLTT